MSPSIPQSVTGFLVPQALLLDERLMPLERNAWLVFRSLADEKGNVTVSYEALRDFLSSSPGSQRAAKETVTRAVLCLRLSTWIELVEYRHHPQTGLGLPSRYAVRAAPLTFIEACRANANYPLLIERALGHECATARQLAQRILRDGLSDPESLKCLPNETRAQLEQLRQHLGKESDDADDSEGGTGSATPLTQDAEAAPDIPKRAPATPATVVRTVQSKGIKEVSTYRNEAQPPSVSEVPLCKAGAMARLQQLDAGQQSHVARRLEALPAQQREDVLAEWDVRCALGQVRSAFAYLCGLIKRALDGSFVLWAARKLAPEPASEAPVPTAVPTPSRLKATPAETEKPASPDVAHKHLQTIRRVLGAPMPIGQVLDGLAQHGGLPRRAWMASGLSGTA